MTQPYFSVILPAYNRQKFIGRTLESIAAQSWRSFEVIVVDDGSSDMTCQIVREFDFVRLIEQQNAGPGSARNRGASEAAGEYLAFLDSDDLWFPWTLECYHQVIDATERPAFVVGSPYIFQQEEELLGVVNEPVRYLCFGDYLESGDQWRWYGVSSFLIRRDTFFRSGGFRNGLVNGEDAELALRVGCEPGFVQVESPHTFGYRRHDGNITGDFERTAEAGFHLIEQERCGAFPGGSRRARERHRIISRHVRPISIECLKHGRRADAWNLYRATCVWHMAELRLKYLVGFPFRALMTPVDSVANPS